MSKQVAKSERIAEFLRRLLACPATPSFEAAYGVLCRYLNEVEDEMTDIPFNPSSWRTDGRMYPPQLNNKRHDPKWAGVIVLRSLGHRTFISENGAIRIETLDGTELLSKPGENGKEIG